jgi:hypothetical protein
MDPSMNVTPKLLNPRSHRRTAHRVLAASATSAALVLATATGASAHTATATATSVCLNGLPVASAQWTNDYTDPATITAGTLTLTLPASGSVTANVPTGNLSWAAQWRDGFEESGVLDVVGRTDCVAPAAPIATTVPPVVIATQVIERAEVQPEAVELARTGISAKSTGWFLAGGAWAMFSGAALVMWAKRWQR